MAERGRPPACSIHELTVQPIARAITRAWLFGVPVLAIGLALPAWPVTAIGCASLFVGVSANAIHLWTMRRRAIALAEPAVERPVHVQPGRAYGTAND